MSEKKRFYESTSLQALVAVIVLMACAKLNVEGQYLIAITAVIMERLGIQGWKDIKSRKAG